MAADKKDFFVSYTGADKDWAVWIAWILEDAGYSVVIQAWDFPAGSNFVLEMNKATEQAERTLLVLSRKYLLAKFTKSEWAAAFASDPEGKQRKVVPVRVEDCHPEGLLAPIVWIDLVGLSQEEACKTILGHLNKDVQRTGRLKPESPPPFPGRNETTQDDTSEQPSHVETIVPEKKSLGCKGDASSKKERSSSLNNLNRAGLLAIAGRLNISGRARMTKDQLREAISQHDPSSIQRATRLSWWAKHKITALQCCGLVGMLASIVGVVLAFYGPSPETRPESLGVTPAPGHQSGQHPIEPPQDREGIAEPPLPAALHDVLISSKTLPVDIAIDGQPCGTLQDDQPSKTVSLTEGRHHLAATKGDIHWEEPFIVNEENRIRLIPSEEAFRKR